MFCSNCGKENPDSAAFCNGCGSSLAMRQADNGSRQRTRNAELTELERLMRYFRQMSAQYEEYDRLFEQINQSAKGKHYALLVWGIIVTVIGGLISSVAFSQMSIDQKGWIALCCLLPGAAMIAGHIFYAKNFDAKRAQALRRFEEVGAELTEHYQNYGVCSVGAEYTNPANLQVIHNTIQSGRADTIKEAINLLIDDAYRNNMQQFAAQTARNTAAAAKGTKAAAVFAAANFFLK